MLDPSRSKKDKLRQKVSSTWQIYGGKSLTKITGPCWPETGPESTRMEAKPPNEFPHQNPALPRSWNARFDLYWNSENNSIHSQGQTTVKPNWPAFVSVGVCVYEYVSRQLPPRRFSVQLQKPQDAFLSCLLLLLPRNASRTTPVESGHALRGINAKKRGIRKRRPGCKNAHTQNGEVTPANRG